MADNPCKKCGGCGKLSTHNGEPWSQFNGLPYNSEAMTVVREGGTSPVTCDACKGLGIEATPKPK